jgi:hypothetical protein
MVHSLSRMCTPDWRNTTSTARGKKANEPLMAARLVVLVWASEVEKLIFCWSHTPSSTKPSVRPSVGSTCRADVTLAWASTSGRYGSLDVVKSKLLSTVNTGP